MIADEIAAIADPHVMRRHVLQALVQRAEEMHAERTALGVEVPDRHAAIVAVIDAASTFWAVESRYGAPEEVTRPSLEEYREIAADTYQVTAEQLPGLFAHAMTREQRARVRAEVVADMRGADDEKGS